LNFWQSGTTFTVVSGRATGPGTGTNSGWANYSGDRKIGQLDKRGNGVYYLSEEEKAKFTYPEAGFIGSAGRNAFRGPRFFNLDVALSKRFRITESSAATFRAEGYNLFNNANFGIPGVTMATPTSLGKFNITVGNPRILQGALRFDF